MVGVGAGAQARVAEQIQSLGSNLIIVAVRQRQPPAASGSGTGSQLIDHRGRRDARSPARCRACRSAALRCAAARQVVYGNLNWARGSRGRRRSYFEARDWPVDRRRRDHPARTSTAPPRSRCSARPPRSTSSASRDPLGQIIRIKKVPFTVVGVLVAQGTELLGAGPGRRHPGPADDREEEGARRRARPTPRAVGRDLRQGPGRRGHDRGRGADPRAAAPASSACSRSRTTTSGSGTSRRFFQTQEESSQRDDAICSRRSPRCRCWSAASAS